MLHIILSIFDSFEKCRYLFMYMVIYYCCLRLCTSKIDLYADMDFLIKLNFSFFSYILNYLGQYLARL